MDSWEFYTRLSWLYPISHSEDSRFTHYIACIPCQTSCKGKKDTIIRIILAISLEYLFWSTHKSELFHYWSILERIRSVSYCEYVLVLLLPSIPCLSAKSLTRLSTSSVPFHRIYPRTLVGAFAMRIASGQSPVPVPFPPFCSHISLLLCTTHVCQSGLVGVLL